MRYFSQVFYMAGARKKYLSYLKTSGTTTKMAPNQCGTRWSSWYMAVIYHGENYALYKPFFKEEMEVCRRSAPKSLEHLYAITQDEDLSMTLQIHLNITAEKSQVLIRLCNLFESNRPATMKVFDIWEDLQITFAANKELKLESCDHFFGPDVPYDRKKKILAIFEQANQLAEEQLSKYMDGAQAGHAVLKRNVGFSIPHVLSSSARRRI